MADHLLTFPHLRGRDTEADIVLAEVNEAKSVMQSFHQKWWEAVAFYDGDQWMVWDRGANRLRKRPTLPWRIRVTDNQTLPLIMRQQAMLIERRPAFAAMPRTNEESDVLAAKAFEALLVYHWDRLDLTDRLADAILWALITGNGFWRVDWDPMAGESVLVPIPDGSSVAGGKDAPKADQAQEEGEPEPADETPWAVPFGETEQGGRRMANVPVGDAMVRSVSPFQMFVDPTSTSLEMARWVCQESFVHIEVLEDRFGKAKASKLAPDVTAEQYYNYEQSLRFDRSVSTYVSGDARAQVRVLEYWKRPTRQHPKGRVITVANGHALDIRDNPYGGRFPYVHFGGIKIPGRFWRDGFVKHLRPLATMRNRATSRYHEHMNLSSNSKWVADKHAGLKETSINDRPGEVIIKNPGSEVYPVPAPPTPTIHPIVMSRSVNSMQTIAGINDPLVGDNPPNVRSASALYGLQEAAMRAFIPMALQTERAIRDAGRLVLGLVQRFYTEDRTFRILGHGNRAKVYHLRRADVARVMDVTVGHGSMAPRSKAGLQERALQLLQMAPMLFMDDDGRFRREWLAEMLNMPAVMQGSEVEELDEAQAYYEHVEAERGETLRVMPWENDRLHMRRHAAKLTDREWVEANEQAAQALAAHYAEHEQQQLAKQMGMVGNLQGPAALEGPPPLAPPVGMAGPGPRTSPGGPSASGPTGGGPTPFRPPKVGAQGDGASSE